MARPVTNELPMWIKLDNAANIYPTTRTRGWTPMFRLSVTLTQPVDLPTLEQAQVAVLKRLPTFACRLRKGAFWYYFERISGAPKLQEDVGNPMVRMDLRENSRFLYRIRWYKNRIAVEFFHALTDGTGGLSFLLTLIGEYLRIRYGADIPARTCRSCPPLPKAPADRRNRGSAPARGFPRPSGCEGTRR